MAKRTTHKTYECGHCGKFVSWDDGADDAIERYVGPICDSCSSKLPPHVHDAAEEWDAKHPDPEVTIHERPPRA
jgi:hypothetical protein